MSCTYMYVCIHVQYIHVMYVHDILVYMYVCIMYIGRVGGWTGLQPLRGRSTSLLLMVHLYFKV